MSSLYKNLAPIYEAMYQSFIDYEEEFQFYSNILQQYGKSEVLEIGSGTGNLAPKFSKNGFQYSGLDYSQEMIDIAQKKIPNGKFLQGDMRNFQLEKPVESIIITARTVSYLLTNKDVMSCFKSICNNLIPTGILSFDFIDANRFIPSISPQKKIIHEALFEGKNYKRESIWSPALVNGMDFNWHFSFYVEEGNDWQLIAEDEEQPRTFTKDEIILLLQLNGFEVKSMIDRASYAFPTYVAVAERKG
ncbi:MAG: SAM-dependent methyltransferase [Polaribacter sp.]|jgi:SAM-dependent methyltransferase